MKTHKIIGLLIFNLLLLCGCSDDLKYQNNAVMEGYISISVYDVAKLQSRGVPGEESGEEVQLGNDDENALNINGNDYKFYIFDGEGNFIFELDSDDVVSTTQKDNNITEFIFRKIDEDVYPNLTSLQILSLMNLKGYNSDLTYPTFNPGDKLSEIDFNEYLLTYTPEEETLEDGTGDSETVEKTWSPDIVEGKYIPMFGISDISPVLKDTQISYEIGLIRALAKIEVEYLDDDIDHDGYVVYVKNSTDWENIYLYGWSNIDENLQEALGSWPGKAPDGKVIIRGEEYYYFDLGEQHTGWNQNLILHNGLGVQIEGPQYYNFNYNYYLELEGSITDVAWHITEDHRHIGRTIYVINETGWDPVYLYTYKYGEGSPMGPGWPGRAPGYEVINGETYIFYDIEEGILNEEISFIFNNGGYGKQLADTALDLTNDLFVIIKEGTPVVEREFYSIVVKNNTGWENLYLYAYGDKSDILGPYPGMAPSGSFVGENGETFSYFRIDKKFIRLNEKLVFNDGNNQSLMDYDFSFGNEDLVLEINEPFTNVKKEAPTEQYYRIYVENNTGWDNLYLYLYGDAEIFGGWPGQMPAGEKLIGEKIFSYFYLPYDIVGKTENIICHNNEGVQYDIFKNNEFTFSSDLFLSLTDTGAQRLENITDNNAGQPYTIYVENQTGWDPLYLYMWGDKELLGAWPGFRPTGNIDIGGFNYSYFILPDDCEGLSEYLIFNNNLGEQLSDYSYYVDKDLYLTLKRPFIDVNILNDRYVFIEDNTGWNEIYLYAWSNEISDPLGSWPGSKPEGTKTINGKTYQYFKYPEEVDGKQVNLIFNNNAGAQLEDYTYRVKADLFLSVSQGIADVTSIIPIEDRPEIIEEKNYYFDDVYLSGYNQSGTYLPTISGYKTTSSPTLPTSVNYQGKNLHFKWDSREKVWYAYIPEMSLSGSNTVPTVNLVFSGNVPITNKNQEFGLNYDHRQSILRNHIYRFKIKMDYNLEIKYTVCEWNEQKSGKIRFE